MPTVLPAILNNEFVRNVLKIGSGSAASQLLTFLFIPVITRIYSPQDYGLLGSFTALLAVLLPAAALTYPIAIVLPKQESEATNIASVSIFTSISLSTLLLLILLVAADSVLSVLNLEPLGNLIFLIPFAMLFGALQQLNQQWLIRQAKYGYIAKVSVLHSLLVNISKVSAGLVSPTGASLIVTTTLGYLLYALLYAKLLYRGLLSAVRQIFSKDCYIELANTARRYQDFPIFRAPQVLIHALSQSIPVLILGSLFGSDAVGYFALSMSVISAPIMLIGKSITDVFYPRASELVNAGKSVEDLLVKSSLSLLVIGLVPLALLFFGGEPIFALVFGQQWQAAGAYASWISLWMLFFLSSRPAISVVPVLQLQKWFLKCEIVYLILRVSAFYGASVYFDDALQALASLSLLNVLIYVYLFTYVLLKSKAADYEAER